MFYEYRMENIVCTNLKIGLRIILKVSFIIRILIYVGFIPITK